MACSVVVMWCSNCAGFSVSSRWYIYIILLWSLCFLLLFSPFLLFAFLFFHPQHRTTWRNKILKRLGVNFFYDEILLRLDLESTLSWLQVPTYQGKHVETSYRLGVNIHIHGAFALIGEMSIDVDDAWGFFYGAKRRRKVQKRDWRLVCEANNVLTVTHFSPLSPFALLKINNGVFWALDKLHYIF